MSDGELLEYLADRANCYISSLRDPWEQKKIFQLMLEITPHRYSLKSWEYTLSYITGAPVFFKDYCEMCHFLMIDYKMKCATPIG